jgi:hypothetical protein
VAVVKREQRTVLGVELDRFQLEEFGRTAALRRLALEEWAKVAMREKAERDEQRRYPLPSQLTQPICSESAIIAVDVSDPEPFYMPDPDLFGHPDAYPMYTGYAAKLEEAGLADRFPREADVRKIAIELLAERYAVEDIAGGELYLIDEAIAEARQILQERRNS